MKFLKNSAKTTPEFQQIANLNPLENFIESTKITIDQELKKALARPTNRNQLNKDTKTLKSLRDPHITIKPADKNLGIVILNSSDYVDQSLIHLASETYIRVASFPEHSIKQSIINILITFKVTSLYTNVYMIISCHKKSLQFQNFTVFQKFINVTIEDFHHSDRSFPTTIHYYHIQHVSLTMSFSLSLSLIQTI